MPAIEVEQVMAAVATMQTDLETYNVAEVAAMEKRQIAAEADNESEAAKSVALASIAKVQEMLADIQARNAPQDVPEIDKVING